MIACNQKEQPMPYPHWTKGVHHDGSAVFVSNPLPTLNETVEIKLRVPADAPINHVFIRTEPDGEQAFTHMPQTSHDDVCAWYTGALYMRNPRMVYRFKIMTDDGAFFYTAAGISRADGPDVYDFKLLADFESPSWLPGTVFYQIFPDRFHNGDPSLTPPPGQQFDHPPQGMFESQVQDWNADPIAFAEGGTVDFFGGDLPGIEQKLDYLLDLGVNALYLNPIFTSPTNHKYNISDFYTVDPHFGGNDALISLSEKLHANSMRYVLDITPNHIGHTSAWFTDAQANPDANTTDYFIFYEHPHSYEAWFGVQTLPKLDYSSEKLLDVMYRNNDAIMKHWLKPPYNADGWRLDVWNMVGRRGPDDYQHRVGRETRSAVKSTNDDAYVFGESFYDDTGSLQGDQLDAMMNYQGFTFPVERWLAGHDVNVWNETPPAHVDTARLPAEAAVEQMQRYMAAVPWAVTQIQFNLLGSHDTPRIMSIVDGDEPLAKLAAVLLFTFPGVPSIYYGDEIGMFGWREPDNRRGMVWDEDRWNMGIRELYQQLIQMKRSHAALQTGGFEVLHAEGAALAYLRESETERMIVLAHRGGEDAHSVDISLSHAGIPRSTTFTGLLSKTPYIIEDGTL
ncbi:MAG: alpha-amylase family glycosyl hydrolase, partial [Chloroflexota bacterium]